MKKSEKIVFAVNNFAIGGAENLLLDLIREIHPKYDIAIVSVLGAGPLKAEFKNLNISLFHAGPAFNAHNIFLKIFWLLLTPLTLVRVIILLNKIKPDRVVTSLYHADVLGIFASTILKIKEKIIIQNDVQKYDPLRKFIRKVFAINKSSKIVAISNVTKDFLEKYWAVPFSKIKVIKPGIDIEKFKQAISPLNAERPTLGILGRLEPVKGHIHLLKALKILKDKYAKEPETLVIGGGSLEKELKDYVQTSDLSKIKFSGMQSDVIKHLKLVDILVVPSQEEGFGLVVLEGLIAQKIVLASDIPAFREQIDSGENGLLYPLGNSNELAKALNGLIQNPEQLQQYRKKLSNWAKTQENSCNIKSMAAKYQELFN